MFSSAASGVMSSFTGSHYSVCGVRQKLSCFFSGYGSLTIGIAIKNFAIGLVEERRWCGIPKAAIHG